MIKKLLTMTAVVGTAAAVIGCGSSGGSSDVVSYPYETVYGDLCRTSEPTPGCTFDSRTGQRITVSVDPDYNLYGHGSDDLWFVEFDGAGRAMVYDDLGRYKYSARAADFAGYVGGSVIGVGNSGMYWEDVAGGTYWLGRNGVLYSANYYDSNYGQAINDKSASEASDANFAALNSESNKKLVQRAADKLVADYGFNKDKAVAVASALNSWAVAAAERGTTTEKDMDKTFKSVFGVQFSDALAAVKGLQLGDKSGMQDVTNRSAAALGLKPHEAQKFIKGMYKKALADWGYDSDSFNW